MAYLDNTAPPDTEAVANGAQRIRELKGLLNTLISQIFSDAGAFLSGWITQAMVATGAIGNAQLAANAVGASNIADNTLPVTKLATEPPAPWCSTMAAATRQL